MVTVTEIQTNARLELNEVGNGAVKDEVYKQAYSERDMSPDEHIEYRANELVNKIDTLKSLSRVLPGGGRNLILKLFKELQTLTHDGRAYDKCFPTSSMDTGNT